MKCCLSLVPHISLKYAKRAVFLVITRNRIRPRKHLNQAEPLASLLFAFSHAVYLAVNPLIFISSASIYWTVAVCHVLWEASCIVSQILNNFTLWYILFKIRIFCNPSERHVQTSVFYKGNIFFQICFIKVWLTYISCIYLMNTTQWVWKYVYICENYHYHQGHKHTHHLQKFPPSSFLLSLFLCVWIEQLT